MKKQILRFLSPALTILGLFAILLVLSSSDGEEGCCKVNQDVVSSTEFHFFNKDSKPIVIGVGGNQGVAVQPQESHGFQQNISFVFSGETKIYLFAIQAGQIVGEVNFPTTLAKCAKLPILVVWDGSNLKVAQ